MEKKSNPKKRYPPKVTKFTNLEYGVSYHKNTISVRQVIELYKNGVLKEDDRVMIHEGITDFAIDLAKGWWNNAALRENPSSRWAIEDRAKLIRRYITEVFTSENHDSPPEENSER